MLCDHCRVSIFKAEKWWGNWPDPKLQSERNSGCVFCKNLTRIKSKGDPLDFRSYVWTATRRAQSRDAKESLVITFRPDPTQKPSTEGSSPPHASRTETDDPCEMKTFYVLPSDDIVPVAQELGTTTGAKQSLNQLKKWIEDCHQNHPRCKHVAHKDPSEHQQTGLPDPAPRRLIKVGRPGDKPYVVDLVNAPYNGEIPRYCTLSWCWGDSTMKMRTEDEADFMNPNIGLPDLKVQKTFKQAIDVTRSLGIGYIWIDALCIIQEGPKKDFHSEGVKMKTVYRESFMTIAAAASTSGSGGLFYPVDGHERQLSDLVPSSFTTDDFSKLTSKGPWTVLLADMWEEELLKSSHLYTRGWVVQERMLSPRVIHFAANQLFWDCQTLTACEVFPCGLPALLDLEAATCRDWRWRLQHRSKLSVKDEQHSQETLWHAAVSHYSSCNLTEHSDKFRAIWGIASVLQDIQGEKYLDGLWTAKLSEQLAWKVDHPRRSSRPRLDKRIPSWSWASIEGKVSLNSRLPQPLKKNWDKVATGHDGGNVMLQFEAEIEQGQPVLVIGNLAIRSSLVEMRCKLDSAGVWGASIDDERFADGRLHILPDSEFEPDIATASAIGDAPLTKPREYLPTFSEGHSNFAMLLAGGESNAQNLSRSSTGLKYYRPTGHSDDARWQGFGLILSKTGDRIFERQGIFRFRNLDLSEWQILSSTWCPTLPDIQAESDAEACVKIWIQ